MYSGSLKGLRLRVFSQVDHFILGHLENAVLGNGKSADIAPGVTQEVSLGHSRGEVDVPIIPLHLFMDDFVELLRQGADLCSSPSRFAFQRYEVTANRHTS